MRKKMAKQILTIEVEYDPDEYPEPRKWDWATLIDESSVFVLNSTLPTEFEVEE